MTRIFSLFSITLLALSACATTPTPVSSLTPSSTPASELPSTTTRLTNTPNVTNPPPQTSPPVVLFTIGMHIEPFGETAQGYGNDKPDYHQQAFFERHVQDILIVATMIEAHGGRMTIQTQSPFTTVALENDNPILAELAERGHEIALHFHEDAHLGKNSERLPVETWCNTIKEEIALIKEASSVDDIRYWSGGNLYSHLLEAATCAGLSVNSDWKNPKTQSTPSELIGLNPWRPAGGVQKDDVSLFAQHDPNGTIIFLPEGLYNRNDFASMRRAESTGSDQAYFDFLEESLLSSIAAAEVGKINVFHFTVHAGEFRGDSQQPFAVLKKFLSEVVDPLVSSGKVQWATFSEMADIYASWETPTNANENSHIVTNSSSGAELYVEIIAPPSSNGELLPALVLVPGGVGDSQDLKHKTAEINKAGFVAIIFDADGRGRSSGAEDYNGYLQQDGLATIIEFVASLPEVDENKIGLVTFSYGVTMGTGALARHPDLPIQFLIDWEGPVNREYTTCGCETNTKPTRIPFPPCDDDDFWSEREALTFIADIKVPYQRIQSQQDHVQKDNGHAIEIVNAAVQAGLPWVRLNDEPANQTYNITNPPVMLPESMDKQSMALVAKYAQEMLLLNP